MDRQEALRLSSRLEASHLALSGEVAGVHRAELAAPLPNGLMGDDDSPLGEKILDVSKTQAEAVVKPDSVADDLGWESVSAVAWRFGLHRESLPGRPPS